jgi:hypothetical protein
VQQACHSGILSLYCVTLAGRYDFACLQEEWPEDEAAIKQIRADFTTDPEVGDKRQELVFIGQVSNVGHICSLIIFLGQANFGREVLGPCWPFDGSRWLGEHQ